MKSSYSLASRYVQAFINILEENNKINDLETYIEFIKKIVSKISSEEDFKSIIQNPLIPEKFIVDQMLHVSETEDFLLKSFLEAIVKKKRQYSLNLILKVLEQYNNERKKIVEVNLITAKSLSEDLIKNISSSVQNKTGRHIEILEEIKEDLIGGLQIFIDDKLFDYSVKGYLENIRNTYVAAGGE
jgi:F-type H+-transporting ATPase subunit delta